MEVYVTLLAFLVFGLGSAGMAVLLALWISERPPAVSTKWFWRVTMTLSALGLAAVCARLSQISASRLVTDPILTFLIYRMFLVIGAALMAAVATLVPVFRQQPLTLGWARVRAFAASPLVVQALCISVAASFVSMEIGMIANGARTWELFHQAGYSARFMQFIIVAQAGGAVALLIRGTTVKAAVGLLIIALGAEVTHVRLGDRASDLLEPVHLGVVLIAIIVLRAFNRRAVALAVGVDRSVAT
jgi:hypothetical protein